MSLTDGIIGCWSPSVRGSGYLLPDLSGTGNHGTLNGMSETDWQSATVYGRSGRVLNGDATNNRVATALRLPTSNMTYGGWVLCRALLGGPQRNRPFGEADSQSGVSGSSLLLATSGPYVVFRGSSAGDINASFPLVNNRWYLFVVVLGRQGEIWVDGRLAGTAAGTTIVSRNVGFQIVVDDIVNPLNGINGLVGEVCVWNRALAQPEVLEWFRRGNGAIGQQLTGQTRRRVYGFVPAGFRAYWARRQHQIIGGGV